jgi:cell division protein FtsB
VSRQHALTNTVVLLCTTVLFVYFCAIGVKNFFRYNTYGVEYQNNTVALKTAKDRNKALKRQLAAMKDTDYWEMHVRKNLGYVREDETVYKLIWK